MYRQAFPGTTHEDYLDRVTVEERDWMLRIHRLVTADNKRRAKEANDD